MWAENGTSDHKVELEQATLFHWPRTCFQSILSQTVKHSIFFPHVSIFLP